MFDLAGYWPDFLLFTGLALVIIPLVFLRTGVYARYWRYASVEEFVLLAGAVTIGGLPGDNLRYLQVGVQ